MAPAGPTKNQGRAIGIDLGTTCSCVGVWRSEHNRVDIIANKRGNRTTPSMVAFAGEERLIGESAKEQAASNPTNTVFDVKRLIGKKFHDSSVQSDKCLWPFSVSDHNWRPVIEVQFRGETTKFMPEKISSIVLENFKNIAEEYLDCDVNNVVITVPAYFNDSQRRATRNAAEIAAFNVLQMLNEPTAAAIAYGLDKETYLSRDGEYILIFDLGGGTFDVSVIHVKKNKFVVKAVGGDTHLGGEDFDNRMVKHFVREFRRVHNEDMSGDASAMQRLRSECESAKRNLSYTTETTNELHNLHAQKDFVLKMQRAEFEALNKNLFEECMEIVKQCLNDAHLNKAQISRVVLVGGSTRIPKVQEMLGSYFDGRDVMCKGINPDEAVAYGAALRAAVLNDGNGISHELVDVTPLSLGTCVYEGKMCFMIPRNTPIPVRKEECFTTCFDDQETMCIDVYEGEKKKCKRNNLLGEFDLCGIPRTGRGMPSVYICFDIDVNGILKVSAHHRKSGLRKEIIINLVGTKRLRKRNMKCAFPFAT